MQKGRLPGSAKQQSKKSFKQAVIEHVEGMQKEVISIKREMNEEIEKQMEKRHGDLIHQVSSALDGVIALRTIFKKKGFITQEEYNKEKAEMRKRKK